MRILKILLNLVIILSGVYIVGGFLIPSEWKVSRSIAIHANPEQIYPLVSNFKEWEKWSPWNSQKDASLQYSYEGPEVGVGAKQNWVSEKMGKGWMQFSSANPETGVAYDFFIDMGRMQSSLQGKIEFAKENDETLVTWTDRGASGKSFMKRWMSLLIKPMLGKDINTGLKNLKSMAEKG
ncbi:MAG: SRPBCC family protein [Tatlockia sp.]|nr:SRPBCC family protein [Tatlockia sp.]